MNQSAGGRNKSSTGNFNFLHKLGFLPNLCLLPPTVYLTEVCIRLYVTQIYIKVGYLATNGLLSDHNLVG